MSEFTRNQEQTAADRNSPEGNADRWRQHLLPLVSRVLVSLTVFYFAVSLVQVTYLHWRIAETSNLDLSAPFAALGKAATGQPSETLNAANTMILAALEANAVERRYHQATVGLMARIWISYIGFTTGMILAIVGAVFILGRVQDTYTEFEAKTVQVGAALRTSAPGIVLAILGVALMMTTLLTRYEISVFDGAVYERGPGNPESQLGGRAPAVHFPGLHSIDTLSRHDSPEN